MLHVLVVDDSKFNRSRVVSALTAEHIVIAESVDGQDALEKLATFPADVLCMDLLMPRLDGFGLLRALRDQGRNVPVVVLSADIQTSSRELCRELGAVAFLNKPFQPQALRAEIEKAACAVTEVL